MNGIDAATRPVRIASPGHAFFAATMVGMGIVGVARHDFTPMWAGVPKGFPARDGLIYFSAGIGIACGLGLLVHRTAQRAARLLLGVLLSWLVVFRMPLVFRAPAATGSWWSLGDGAAMAGAAWVLFAWFEQDRDRTRVNFLTGDNGLRIARALFGLALIPFGIAHFTYLERTTSMVPNWLPWHLAWAYLTGAAFIAAGIAIAIGVLGRLAAILTTLQVGLFTILVWIPIVTSHPKPSDWTEFVNSWGLTAAAWMIADSWRKRT